MLSDPASSNADEDGVDPFHEVNRLLPDEQLVVSVSPETRLVDVLDLMDRHRFSQVPIMDGGSVLGCVTFRSIARAAIRYGSGSSGTPISDLPAEDCAEPLPFFRSDDEINRLFEALDRSGAVLVGQSDNLIAVATATDVINYLYHVTQPFVLLQEIELAIRSLVWLTTSGRDLVDAIQRAGLRDARATTLEQLSFGSLVRVIADAENYPAHFARTFGSAKDLVVTKLETAKDLRNVVFHFKREVTVDDFDTLVEIRHWLQRKLRRARQVPRP